MLGREADRIPAALDELGVGLLEACGRAHDAVLERRAGDVAGAIERRQHLAGEPRRAREHGIDEVWRHMRVRLELRQLGQSRDRVERETHLGKRCLVSARLHLRAPGFFRDS